MEQKCGGPSLNSCPRPCPSSESGVLRIGLNMRCCNEVEKRDEIRSMFKECKLDILGLSKTKLKGEGELSFGGVSFQIWVERRGNAREGVAVLMNEHMRMCVREIRRVNLKIIYVSICIKREFWTIIVVYVPGMERSEERDVFWEELKGCIDVCEDRGKVVII